MPSSKAKRGVSISDIEPFLRKTGQMHLLDDLRKPANSSQGGTALPISTPAGGQGSAPGKKRGKKRREMNQNEREFLAWLKREHSGALSIEYEGITLRWGEGPGLLAYTPDFSVKYHFDDGLKNFIRHIFYEVKGSWAWQKDIVKFKAAKAHFEEYEFELWEKDDQGRFVNTI